jgi:hypothetical protein
MVDIIFTLGMNLSRKKLLALSVLLIKHKRQQKSRKRFLEYKKEAESGNDNNFRNYVRMSLPQFEKLLSLVQEK